MDRLRFTSCLLVSAAIVGLAFTGLWANEHGAKSIFYNGSGPTVMAKGSGPAATGRASTPSPQAAKEEYMGLTYWVEMVGSDGQKRRVTTDRVFTSGDRIKLHVQSNRDGYLYVLNLGSTGRTHMLFPSSSMPQGGNAIKGKADYEVPYSSFIRFDDNPGEEKLLLMLSPAPIGDMTPMAESRTATLTTEDAARLLMAAESKGAKDLVLETDAAGSQPAGYAVAPVSLLRDGGMITLQIKLKHQ